MTDFETIIEKARERHGGASELEELLPEIRTEAELHTQNDAYYLSNMSRRIFRAGLKHSMVDAKWPAFEEVFHDFDIEKARMMSDDDLQDLLKDKRIIRHWGKIKSVRANAQSIYELRQDNNNIGQYIAEWPNESLVDLWNDLTKRFTQLGGMSGPYFLRMVGRDSFILTKDVIKALNHWGAYQGVAKSKKDKQHIQEIFNQYVAESNRPLCQISRILALSID